MNKQIDIRQAKEEDLPSIFELVCELATFERARDEVTVDVLDYIRDFREGLFKALVIELDQEIIGTMIYYLTYSTWKGKMVYLEDFIITENHRNHGYGTHLFEHFIEHCKDLNASIVRWQVLDWNEKAIRFYRKFPVQFDPEWLTVKWIL